MEVLNNKMFEIGVDIEKVERFKNITLENDAHFLKTIFTDAELEYSFSDGHYAQHLCARFCAKEAAIKALSSMGLDNISLKDIEISNNKEGVPQLKIKNYKEMKTKVSLSHTSDNAIAFVVIGMEVK